MKILVCISQTPDTTAKVSFNADSTEFNGAGVTFIMNPYDEWYALVRACDVHNVPCATNPAGARLLLRALQAG